MIECKICSAKLKSVDSMRMHVKKKHNLTYKEYRLKFNEIEKKYCKNCNKSIDNIHHNNKYCSDICKRNYPYEKKYGHIKDIPRCRFCNMPCTNLTSHISVHHNMKLSDYMKKFDLKKEDVFHKSYTNKLGLSGSDNPAYNHGGKYSPFSKNFIYYNEENRQRSINKAVENRTYNSRIEYFLEESNCNWNLAEYLRNKRQGTFSKKVCIEKYGKEKGIEIWKERQSKWLSSYKRVNFSKISQKLFMDVYNLIKDDYKEIFFAQLDNTKNIDYSGRNYEYKLDIGSSFCKPDFLVKDNNKIIEFDGDYWHNKKGNKERDKCRDDKIKNMGYKVLHIKEKDYKFDPKKCIMECIDFINE